MECVYLQLDAHTALFVWIENIHHIIYKVGIDFYALFSASQFHLQNTAQP